MSGGRYSPEIVLAPQPVVARSRSAHDEPLGGQAEQRRQNGAHQDSDDERKDQQCAASNHLLLLRGKAVTGSADPEGVAGCTQRSTMSAGA